MIKTKTIKVETDIVDKVICDKCKKEIDPDDLEFPERFSYSEVGGYGSPFGAGICYSVDLCQHCWWELIKDYINIE